MALCACGCGEETPLCKRTLRKAGYVAGEPLRYIPGHQNRGRRLTTAQRAARSERQRGHPVSAATRAKISRTHRLRGIRPSAEAGAKSRANRGTREQHASWKGGLTITNGYRCVYAPEHPRAMPNGYVYEHIVAAERAIGRPLRKGEVVHHIDGDKQNNEPANLRVMPSQAAHVALHRAQGDLC